MPRLCITLNSREPLLVCLSRLSLSSDKYLSSCAVMAKSKTAGMLFVRLICNRIRSLAGMTKPNVFSLTEDLQGTYCCGRVESESNPCQKGVCLFLSALNNRLQVFPGNKVPKKSRNDPEENYWASEQCICNQRASRKLTVLWIMWCLRLSVSIK